MHKVSPIDNMLSNKKFEVIMGNSKSGVKNLNNGHSQGSVLAPVLFSLYDANIQNTQSGIYVQTTGQ